MFRNMRQLTKIMALFSKNFLSTYCMNYTVLAKHHCRFLCWACAVHILWEQYGRTLFLKRNIILTNILPHVFL